MDLAASPVNAQLAVRSIHCISASPAALDRYLAAATGHVAHPGRSIHALEMKAVPPLVLVTIVAGLLGLLLKWFEHGLIRLVRSARAGRKTDKVLTNTNVVSAGVVRHCPICHSQMVKRKARRESRAGQEFWGCPNYPECRGTRPI
jgi:Topoisomerase DNA binding C4 zinc finger